MYPNTKYFVPSAACSHPSYAGATFWPFEYVSDCAVSCGVENTERTESTETISHGDTETQRTVRTIADRRFPIEISVSPCLCGWMTLCPPIAPCSPRCPPIAPCDPRCPPPAPCALTAADPRILSPTAPVRS